jgi:hypothetical protein
MAFMTDLCVSAPSHLGFQGIKDRLDEEARAQHELASQVRGDVIQHGAVSRVAGG